MAHIDIAKIHGISSEVKHANISDIVGIGARNEINDVMLIQALFKLVGHSQFKARQYFNLDIKDLPEPTGDFNVKTIRAISAFQAKMQHRLLNADGKIHPANYKDRVIKNVHKRVMVITLLNMTAQDGALMDHNTDAMSALKIVAPQLVLKAITP